MNMEKYESYILKFVSNSVELSCDADTLLLLNSCVETNTMPLLGVVMDVWRKGNSTNIDVHTPSWYSVDNYLSSFMNDLEFDKAIDIIREEMCNEFKINKIWTNLYDKMSKYLIFIFIATNFKNEIVKECLFNNDIKEEEYREIIIDKKNDLKTHLKNLTFKES